MKLQFYSIDSNLNEFIPTHKPIKRKYGKGNNQNDDAVKLYIICCLVFTVILYLT